MDGRRSSTTSGREIALKSWQRNATKVLSESLERPARSRPVVATIRAVTPEVAEQGSLSPSLTPIRSRRPYRPSSERPTRPASISEDPRERRQGFVFDDSFQTDDFYASQQILDSPRSAGSPDRVSRARPQTHTLDDPRIMQPPSLGVKSRQRIGSIHSPTPASFQSNYRHASDRDGIPFKSLKPLRSLRSAQPMKATTDRDKIGRRLQKKSPSRPASPLGSPTPSLDSLPYPLPTSNAKKVLELMKSLKGYMRGALEYRLADDEDWRPGLCSIHVPSGALVEERRNGKLLATTVIEDLRGCQVRPAVSAELVGTYLEITTIEGNRIQLLPQSTTDFDHWLAAFLSWQQSRSGVNQINLPTSPYSYQNKVELTSSTSSTSSRPPKEANIIKVGKILLWDNGPPASPASESNKSHHTATTLSSMSWRKVSCILQDNGEFKLLTETDVVVLAIVQLSQLSRWAIQQLDRSVLNERYCIAILPQYTSSSTSISIIRPIYIALDSRVQFEVWFVLLRAFTIPEIYGIETVDDDVEDKPRPLTRYPQSADMFRIENSLSLRIFEAKLRSVITKETAPSGKTSSISSRAEMDPTIGDYFAEILVDGDVRSRTVTKTNTRTPFWREDSEFRDVASPLPELAVVLKRRLAAILSADVSAHQSASGSGVFDDAPELTCGEIHFDLGRLAKSTDCEQWWPVLDETERTIGEMLIKIRHDELIVLMAKDYEVLSELLHTFSNGLTTIISHQMPSKLRYISELLMNIFQASGSATTWLMALIEDEIDGIAKDTPVTRLRFSKRLGSNDSFDSVQERELSVRDMSKSLTGEANLLFRGNSILTQALDFHMRRLGKEYLEDVLGAKIREINALCPNCEVDPARVAQGDDITKHWSQLISLTTSMWESIATSAGRCPPGLRQILKYVRSVAEDRYGEFLRTVPYTSVSGFLFLRFFCPAILNPKLFDLLPDHPQVPAQRTLTLIAKSLQVLANLSAFGQKEAWMEPMNRFLTGHRQSLRDFIDEICSISADRSQCAQPASYSTPLAILARLPPTSQEGFPTLPYLIDRPRNFAALVKFWLENTLQLNTSLYEGDLLEFHHLCLDLQQRTDECLTQAEHANHSQPGNDDYSSLRSQESSTHLDHTHLDLPNLSSLSLDQTLQHSIHSSHAQPVEITLAEYEANAVLHSRVHHAPSSTTSSHEGDTQQSTRDRQNFWETTFGKDSRYQRPYGPSPSNLSTSTLGLDDGVSSTGSRSPPRREGSNKSEGKRSEGHPDMERSTQKGFLRFAGLRKKQGGQDRNRDGRDGRDDERKTYDRVARDRNGAHIPRSSGE